MRYLVLLLAATLALLSLPASAQIPVGQWRIHLPYAKATCVEKVGSRVYCGTENGLFYYDTDDNALATLTKVQGVSDVDITYLKYAADYNTLIITYRSGNIDLLRNGQFMQLDAIPRSTVPGLKTIFHVHQRGRFAYLSTAFGIVELDLQRREIRNTFIIGPQGSRLPVNALADDGTNFYAATDSGMYVASLSAPNLSNFNFWTREPLMGKQRLNHIAVWRNKVYTLRADSLLWYDGSSWQSRVVNEGFINNSLRASGNWLLLTNVFRAIAMDTLGSFQYNDGGNFVEVPRQCLFEEPGRFWIADSRNGLVESAGGQRQLLPNGPASSRALMLSAGREGVMVAAGSLGEAWNNLFIPDGVFQFKEQQWKSLNGGTVPALAGKYDYVGAYEHPTAANKLYLLPWGFGVYELTNGQVTANYTPENSTLEYIPGSIDPNTGIGATRVGGLDWDKDGNLWMSNYGASNPVSVRKKDGSWASYRVGPYNEVYGMLADSYGNKWIRVRSGGVVVLNRANTDYRFVGTAEGQGSLPSPIVNCMVEDKDGAVWLGTDEGPVVFYSPNAIFRGPFNGSRIKVLQEQFVGFLLGQEVVSSIAIDGANRKWFGTNSGAWLFSADGSTLIHHFTRENSPMLSNIVTSIAIDPASGEVFIGTDKGVVSFRGTATEGGEVHNNVQVFPNPVPADFGGQIAVNGLVANAWIKITDIHGQLVYQTRADGGQIAWNGRDYNGQKVGTGVYYILSTDDLGNETFAAKVLFLH